MLAIVPPVPKHLLRIVWRKRLGLCAAGVAETITYPHVAQQRWNFRASSAEARRAELAVCACLSDFFDVQVPERELPAGRFAGQILLCRSRPLERRRDHLPFRSAPMTSDARRAASPHLQARGSRA